MLHTADGLCRGDMRGVGARPVSVSGRVSLSARRTVRVRSGRTGQLPFGRADGVGRWRAFGPLSGPSVRSGRPRRARGAGPALRPFGIVATGGRFRTRRPEARQSDRHARRVVAPDRLRRGLPAFVGGQARTGSRLAGLPASLVRQRVFRPGGGRLSAGPDKFQSACACGRPVAVSSL